LAAAPEAAAPEDEDEVKGGWCYSLLEFFLYCSFSLLLETIKMAAGDFDSGSFFFFPLFSQLPFVRLCFLSSSSFFCLFVYLPCVTALSLEKPLLSVFVRGLLFSSPVPFQSL
jgi:hypothetical protein